MELMQSPHTNRRSFGNRFNNYWGHLINRDFFLGRDPFTENRLTKEKKRPPFNLKKLEGYHQIEIPLSGYKKNQISIQIINDVLVVKGKKEEEKELNTNYIIKEHGVDNFIHSYQLGKLTNQNNITATFINGMLKINLYRVEEASPKEKRINFSII